MAIITMLAAMLLPTVSRAFHRVRGMAQEWEAPQIAEMLVHESRRYCEANPQFGFNSKSDFVAKCRFAPKCLDWIEAPSTQFVPFNFQTASNAIVLSVHIGRNGATLYSFSKDDLSSPPPAR